jgi:hypothetical protein
MNFFVTEGGTPCALDLPEVIVHCDSTLERGDVSISAYRGGPK